MAERRMHRVPSSLPNRPGGRRVLDLLKEHRIEIEGAILDRAYGVAQPPRAAELDYLSGIRSAVGACIDFAIQVLEEGQARPTSPPSLLLSQARLAARNDVPLDVVMRRYFAGYLILTDRIVEMRSGSSSDAALREALGALSAQFDHLVLAVADEYKAEATTLEANSKRDPRVRLIKRLLAGENTEVGELAYDLSVSHMGLVVSRVPGIEKTLHDFSRVLDCSLLLVAPEPDRMWAWLGSRHTLLGPQVAERATDAFREVSVSVGGPAIGLRGWRLTHRQAQSVYSLAERQGGVVTYMQTGVVAAAMRDETLIQSLDEMYLAPLSSRRDSGRSVRETLRVYFAAGRNITSTAAALNVNRQTVRKRLRAAEELLGRSLDECAMEVELALRIGELDRRLSS